MGPRAEGIRQLISLLRPLSATVGFTDYIWHCNRHTFCSRLVAAGVSLKTVQVLAGHKTISMTARYSHLAPNTLHSAVECLATAP